jgi:hypothetical protein
VADFRTTKPAGADPVMKAALAGIAAMAARRMMGGGISAAEEAWAVSSANLGRSSVSGLARWSRTLRTGVSRRKRTAELR